MGQFIIITLGGSTDSTAEGVPIIVTQLTTGPLNQPISPDNPLDVREVFGPSGIEPLLGNLAAVGVSPTPFTPIAGRPFTVSGVFSGDAAGIDVQVVKSYDEGATYLPLFEAGNPSGVFQQTFSQQFEEPEANVGYYIEMTARAAGSVATRISQ